MFSLNLPLCRWCRTPSEIMQKLTSYGAGNTCPSVQMQVINGFMETKNTYSEKYCEVPLKLARAYFITTVSR